MADLVIRCAAFALFWGLLFRGRGGVFNEIAAKITRRPVSPSIITDVEARAIYAGAAAASFWRPELPWWAYVALGVALAAGTVLPYFTKTDRMATTWGGFWKQTARGVVFIGPAAAVAYFVGLDPWPLAAASLTLGVYANLAGHWSPPLHDLTGWGFTEFLFGATAGLGAALS